MHQALVENAQHHIDGEEGCEHQIWFAAERLLKRFEGAGWLAMNGLRHVELAHELSDFVLGLAEGNARRKVERQRY